MRRFAKGDRIRVDIPDETDPDHEAYHGLHGRVVAVLTDDADSISNDIRDSELYRITLETGETTDFRWRDLRPPVDVESKLK
jgi:hypothetical protein